MQLYTLETPAVEVSFDEFRSDPEWCDVSYTYSVDVLGQTLISSWDDLTRTFIFDYQSGFAPLDNDPLLEFKDFTVNLISMTGLSRPVTTYAPFTLRV